MVLMVVLAFVFRDEIERGIMRCSLQKLTGASCFIDSIRVHLVPSYMTARNVLILNPQGAFQEPVALKINLLETDYDLASIRQFSPHIQKLILDVYEINVVFNQKGELNLQGINACDSAAKNMQIDELILSLQNVRYLDERLGMPSPLGYKAHIKDKRYTNLRSADDVKKLLTRLALESLPSQKPVLDPQKKFPDRKTRKASPKEEQEK